MTIPVEIIKRTAVKITAAFITVSSRFGIIETNAIRATDSAAKTALRAILDVFFISCFISILNSTG